MSDFRENSKYNEEEVKELFDVVFKLSAKDIHDKLVKVRNRPEIAQKRWFWELLQNAKDAVKPNERVSVKLILDLDGDTPFIEFTHNGNPFRYQDAKNLIFPYSDKEDEVNSDKSGRFGTGFLATHILSQEIQVNGIYIKDMQAYDFKFTLDRSGNDKLSIANSIDNTWQEFRNKSILKDNYTYNQNYYDTSFKYYIKREDLDSVSHSISEIETTIPFVLAFIPKIEIIEIINKIKSSEIKYHKLVNETKVISDFMNITSIEKTSTIENQVSNLQIKIVKSSDGIIDLAIEILENGDKIEVKEFPEHQPLLFCPFPLIGAKEFKFPVIINSESFQPKEERDGIWLADTKEGLENQNILISSIALYALLITYASENNWGNCYLLLKHLKETLTLNDFNTKWFKEKIQDPIKGIAKESKIVDLPAGNIKKPIINGDEKIYFPYDLKGENRDKLWEFSHALFANNVPQKNQIHNWYEIVWDDCPRFTISTLTKQVASYKTIEGLSQALNAPKEYSLNWLNDFIAFVVKEEPALLNTNEFQILPNQLGAFKKKDELYLDDGTIDDEIKNILFDLTRLSSKVYDWRKELLEKKIFLELPGSRTRTLGDISLVISEVIKELLKEDVINNEHRNLFSRLLNWLNDFPYIAKEHFKGIKTESLLYKTANETKIKHLTELLQKDRDGTISFEELSSIDPTKMALLNDPNFELKLKLGEQVLEEQIREQEEFVFKKMTGDIFESVFRELINSDNRFSIQKVEGEEDFIITNVANGNSFYIELKSIKIDQEQISMTHRQAKKAYSFPEKYFLCVIPNDGGNIDQDYFIKHAIFDSAIGVKLANKVREAIKFESSDSGISVEFEDDLLKTYSKHRYKFNVKKSLWGNEDINLFKEMLIK